MKHLFKNKSPTKKSLYYNNLVKLNSAIISQYLSVILFSVSKINDNRSFIPRVNQRVPYIEN